MVPYLCEIKIQQHTLGKNGQIKCFESNRAQSENSLIFHLTHLPFKVRYFKRPVSNISKSP